MASDVSQRAREAAASLILEHWGHPNSMSRRAFSVRAGDCDHDLFVQAFALFEAEIRADATAIERERCANAVLGGAGYNWAQIADAIRKGPTT
jgi:hypothetical protein